MGSWPARAWTQPAGHFPLGFLDGGFKFRREVLVVFDQVVETIAYFTEFRLRKRLQLGLNLSDLAHGLKLLR
jgi:hypothetical protein